jgi:heat shock protein HslJ
MCAGRNAVMALVMGMVAGGTAALAMPAQEGLVGVYWKAAELAGMPVPALAANREPHLVLGADGRFSGADGCNRLTGSYTLKGQGITFGPAAGTQMACPDTAEVERRFRGALQGTGHWSLVGGQLHFFGATGKPLAVFDRATLPSPPPGPAPLKGTNWQLVRFRGGDDRVLTPDDPAKYTIAFAADGRLSARIDCNRGAGNWKVTGSNQLELGPLALTRAMCPAGSLHDHIVKQWSSIRSFLMKDGHLFLVLMADGGTFEFEPRAAAQ